MQKKNIGVLHTAFIGDLACVGLLIEGLTRSGHRVILFTKGGPQKLYQNDRRLEKVVKVEKASGLLKVKSILSEAKKIQDEHLDVLLVPHQSATSTLMARQSQVPERVGFQKASLSFFHTQTVPWDKDVHESVRLLKLGKHYIEKEIYAELSRLGRPVLDVSLEKAPVFLQNMGCGWDDLRPFFIVAPGSVWHTKVYPPEKLAKACAELLLQSSQLRCVVSGGPGDEAEIEIFLRSISKLIPSEALSKNVVNALDFLPLAELPFVTSQAAFTIANDSAPLHVASGVNCPVIGIYGPTSHIGGLGPVSQLSRVVTWESVHGEKLGCRPCSPHGGHRCPKGHHKCMKNIPADAIVKEVQGMLPTLFS